ncbi:AbrB/MazE/SpoVT family DNA-binding domain-containing protein [Rhodovastum atsumiense]|uniref:AbrB/MazE/SpoVT family DNA-binding domain-containing protein n=1 Tax=Rhodovastum atsumiense TaxID=504468 RepID=A0A5M6ILG1_9PROT|nr:AbrB/MazE/SpoVT family DNA-binding domain-containing protein [Rhodovastum atsumiense]
MPATVTRNGQVTIPKPARDKLGIGPGSAVGMSTDEIMALTRGDGWATARAAPSASRSWAPRPTADCTG